MTSVEKRRSSRRSRGHRKHRNGGFSNSSNGGSFLDETDREVSNLTDRAFRSLCIGDEAVYNDSDLSLSSPSAQRDRQLAFGQDRAREEQNRAEQESFSLRVQQYGQEWIFGGVSGADIHRDPQWDVYGERRQRMVSATFQHSFVGTSQQGKPLREGELSLFSNGASELSSQQRRSRSRVSSLVKAFSSDGHRDEAGMDDHLREWSDGTSWDRSALMSIQRELSELSASYQQNLDSHQFPSASQFSPQNTNFYSSQVGTMAQISHSSASTYLTSSHIKDSKSSQVNSNFFMHSEFSPFRLWRDHDRFPFQQGELSGFMQRSEFPKWYQTPMYNELSFANQSQDPYRDLRHQRNTQAPESPSTRSISTSTVTQKFSAVEKRCESELAGHYPHMRWTQRLGTNKLPTQRPSTASPTVEMSRRVRDTISSVKALQQKVKMMSVQNIATDETHQQGALCGRAHLDNTVNSAVTVESNVFSSNTRSSFDTCQLLTPSVYAQQEAEALNSHHYDISPQPVEHPPVRAESRGATPDVRMSSYKSRATSLLFNLKDNRKRVKSTYSPTKFKGLDAPERNKQDPHETVIDIPAFSDPDIQLQLQEPRRTNAAANQYHNPGQSLDAQMCQPERSNTGQHPENTWAQTQDQIVHHSGFSSFIPGNYTNYQLTNGQNPYEYVASFAPYKQDYFGSMEQLQQSYSAVDTASLNTDSNQSREYLLSKANTEQAFNETVGGVSSKVNRYEQLIENKQNYKNASSLEKWRQTNSQNTENVNLKTDNYSPKQERVLLLEQPGKENQSSRHKGVEIELNESLLFGQSVLQKTDLVGAKVSNQLELEQGQKVNEVKDGVLGQISKHTEQDGRTQHSLPSTTEKPIIPQNIGQINPFMPELKKQENHCQHQIGVKPQLEINKNSSNPESLPSPTMTHQLKAAEIKSEQATAENAQDSKAEETKTQLISQVEPLKNNSAELTSSQKTGSENLSREELKPEPTKLESQRKAKQGQFKEVENKGVQKEHFTMKEPEQDGEKEKKKSQIEVQQLTDEPKRFTEKAEHEYTTEERAEAEQAETEKLKEEHVRTDLPETEMAGIKQAEVEQPTRKTMNPEEVKEDQLLTEQTEGDQMEAEQVMAENMNPKVEDEHRKEEQQVKELQTKAKYIKVIEDEVTEIKTGLIKVDSVQEVEKNTDLSHVGPITAEKSTRATCAVKDTKSAERKTEQATLKGNKLDRCRAELSTTENLLERSDHLTAKLTASQHVRREPDKVEQVKTELAKAKAELAKIKEKMRGEQKEKVKNNPILKDNGASKMNIPLSVNMDKTKDGEKQHEFVEAQTHKGADDCERLGENYGFTNATATNRNKMPTGSVTSEDVNEIDNGLLDEAGTENNAKLKERHSLVCSFIAANTENKIEVSSVEHKEVIETQSVHNESPKEIKLSDNSCPTNSCKEATGDTSPDKLKTSGQMLEKCDSLNDTISPQRGSHLEKLLPLQRKPESNENSADLSRDVAITPARALSLKERAQTKQEILTSKIKAHAEKEISAIKEKGFTLRDGFIGKSSTKHLAIGQSVNIRQRPPSLDVPKNHENAVSNNVLPKHQMEPSGIQAGPAKFVPAQSCAAITGRFAATTAQIDNLEKSTNQTANRTVCTKEGKKQKEKEQSNHTDMPGKHKDELQQKVKGDIFNKRKEDQTQDARVDVVNAKSVTAEVEIKEAAKMDSTPLNVVFGSKEMTEIEDSLQIMGVVVTVRERKPSENVTYITGKITAETENECNKSELNKDRPSQGQDKNEEANSVKETDEKKPPSTVKEDLTEVDRNNYLENVQQTLSLEAKKKYKAKNVTEERTNLQQDSSKVNPDPQSEAQPQPTTEKGTSFSVTAPAMDKMLIDTQTPLYKQNTTAEKPKDIPTKTAKEHFSKSSTEMKIDKESNQQQMQTAQINANATSVIDSKIKDSKAESLIKQLSVKEDMTVENINQSSNIDGRSAPLQEEKGKALNSENRSTDSQQLSEKHSKEDLQDVNVRIESIAIRVVPAVTKEDSEEGTEKHCGKSFSSDMKHQQNVPSSCDEEANTSNNEHCSKGLALRSEQKTEGSLEDKLAVQNVLSSVRKLSDSLKASSKRNSTNTNSERCNTENETLESKMQSVEGDYFQIQGVTEPSSEARGNKTTTEDKLKGRELPGLLPNTAAISNESCKGIKSEVFMFSLDQSNKISSLKMTQEENIKKEKLDREATLASNRTDGPIERWSKTEKREVGQSDPVCKRKEEQRHSSTVKRQSSRESQPTKTNVVPEKSEVKPKPKGRTSTIPEISALADYARLKVIVAEDKDETPVQEFPPNKKDGFFPLIHTRHSRPPVFTEGPKELSVKEKLPNKTEGSAKVNKEPKLILFPIVEKEHQRTGMFKLGDKDKQEETVLDAKMNFDLLKKKDDYSSQKEINKSSTQTEQPDLEKNDVSTVQSKNGHVMAPSFVASRAENSSDVLTYLQPTLGTENSTHPVKNESPEIQRENKTRGEDEHGRKGGLKQEKLTSQYKEIKAKQPDPKQQSEEERASVHEKEQNKEDIKIKNMIEERRASLAEEERRATRREEDRRAREREAVATMIKERREKQRRAEIKAEEERKTRKRGEETILKKEEVQTQQNTEPVMTETDGRRTNSEDKRAEKLQENQNERKQQHKEERKFQEDQQRRVAEEEQRKSAQVEKQRRLAEEEHGRKYAQEEHQKGEAEENKQRAALKGHHRQNVLEERPRAAQGEMQRKALQEEQQKLAEDQRKRAALEEQRRRAAQEEFKRKHALEELQRRAAQEERQRKALQEEHQKQLEEEQRRVAQEEQQEEQQRRAAKDEQQRRAAQMERQRRAAKEEKQEEQQRRAAQEEQQRKAEKEENQRRSTQVEQQRRAAQREQQKRTAQEKQEEQQRRDAQDEQQRRALQEEKQKRSTQEEKQRSAQEEEVRKTAQVEQQIIAAQAEQQIRAAKEEQQRRAAQEEQQRRTAQEEQQRRAAKEEQQRRAAKEEQQRRAAQEEQQRRAAKEEQQRRAAQEEQQRRTAKEEQQRRTAQVEQQIRAVHEEQQRRAAQEEQQTRAAKEEQQVRAPQKEQQRRAAQEEQLSALQKEQQNKSSQEEQEQRDVVQEQQSRDAQEEQQRRASQEEKQRRALHEQQRRAEHVEQQRRVEEEHQRKAVQEKQQRISALIEEQRQAKQIKEKIVSDIQEKMERKPGEEERLACHSEEERIKLIHEQGNVQQPTEEQQEEIHRKGRWMKSGEKRAAENNILNQRKEKQSEQGSSVHLEKNIVAQEQMQPKRENDAWAKNNEEGERDTAKIVPTEKHKRAVQKMDALQYYAISSSDTEKKLSERHLSSPLTSRKTINQPAVESTGEVLYHTRPHKPNAAASPAPPLPRSNTSSPALGVKPLMFRVKDNTFRGSTFTKSVKPRFHKNFGEDFWMGSPSDRAEDEQETMRRSAGTPVSPEKGFNQFAPISESAKVLSASPPDFSTSVTHQRPYSRRSMALDDDESRSIVSNMSEDVESFATSAADVADIRGLLDYERPESACSFSSDASRSLGKPPTVPPKSEQAQRRAQRLTSHRIKKERAKAAAGSLAGVENKVSSCPSSTEVCSSNQYAVASPHFSAPVAFAHAPSQGSSLPSSHTESSHQSSQASPHATGPVSLPISLPDEGYPPSPPSVSLHASNKASKPTAPQTTAHVSSSSTPHLIHPHSAAVTQYHVESSPYHQSYPLTQRKVLQDLGSGQYFLVDVPVQVKTKTFFDPETGKYVQLNVRQSGQNISRTQTQQTYPQAQLQPQMQIKSQQQPLSQASFAAKPFVFYQGYHSYPQSYQPSVINSVHPNRSSGHLQQHPGESNTSTEGQQNSEGHRYSPEKTNYMDTVNDIKRTHMVNNTQDSKESLSECNSNNQLIGSTVCEKDNATTGNSLYQPRDIISMSELEDFMEASDW